MYYIIYEQTVDPLELRIDKGYQVLLKPFIADSTGIVSKTSYTAVYDESQHLALAQISNESTRDQHSQEDDTKLHIHQQHQRLLCNHYRLRTGHEKNLPVRNGLIKSLDAQQQNPSRQGRFMVVYQQPLDEIAKPLECQEVPILVGLAEDEEPVAGVLYGVDVVRDMLDAAVYQDGTSLVWLSSWPTIEAATRYTDCIDRREGDEVHLIEVLRDHGMHDQGENSA